MQLQQGLIFCRSMSSRENVRDDVATITNSPLIPEPVTVLGMIYDVLTGRLRRVRPHN